MDTDTVIHPDTEDEGGDHDVDQVEFQAQDGHQALQDVPAQEHGQESQEGRNRIPESNEKHEEHQQGRDPLRGVEVIMDDFHHVAAVVERLQDQGVLSSHAVFTL